MRQYKNKILSLAALVLILPMIGIGCKGSGTISQDELQRVTLEYWRVFDEPDDFSEIITAFRQNYPHITINVRKFRFEEYEGALLRALAEGRGPDIVSIHNTWVNQYQNIIAPMPEAVTLPTTIPDGRQQRIVLRTQPMLSLRDLRNNFVDVVVDDAVLDNNIYGLPLSVDTLVLYYNKTMLTRENIPTPAATWNEFKEHVKLLTLQDRNGNFVQSGASMGTARNINRGPDILAVLMMQNGTEMTDVGGYATFNLRPAAITNREVLPGRDALQFYTDFANPAKEVYTWNETMNEALDAFTNQKSAYFFGYSYHLPLIRSLAPGLDFGIVGLPQIAGAQTSTNFANYWLESVTKQSEHQNEAWAFIDFATQQNQVVSFLNRANKPTALRTLISLQRNDDDMHIFANQILTAQSWYRGSHAAVAEEAFRAMIDQVVNGEYKAEDAITIAAQKINETL